MSYDPKYTSFESIQMKLRSKLRVIESYGLPSPYDTTSIAQTAVDPDFLYMIIEDNEDFLDEYLGLVYVLPLQKKHSIVKKAVDSLCLADLMQYHFNVTGINESGDISGYGSNNKNEAYQIIKSLTYGLNVNIPNMPPDFPGNNSQPLILQGEAFVTRRSAIPTTNITIVGKFNKHRNSNIDFYPDYYSPNNKHNGRENPWI